MEIGLYSFAENTPDPLNGDRLQSPAERLGDLLEEIELADQLGLDFYGLGEHHRADYRRVLAGDDPRRRGGAHAQHPAFHRRHRAELRQSRARLPAIRNARPVVQGPRRDHGRPRLVHRELSALRLDLEDYDDLFEEKLEQLLAIRKGGRVSWPGSKHTTPIPGMEIWPKPVQDPLPLWIAVGGTPNSVARAAFHALPLMVAIIGGRPQQFAPLMQLYRDTATKLNHDLARLPIGVSSHGFIAEDSQEALNIAYPAHHEAMSRIGRERGWPPTTREQFEAGASPQGAYFVGSPQQVIDKILMQHEWFGHQRFGLQLSVGTLPHEQVMKAIELLGTVVKPAIDKALGPKAA